MTLVQTDDKSILVQLILGAIRHETITWANVDPDLCCNMESLGHNELAVLKIS